MRPLVCVALLLLAFVVASVHGGCTFSLPANGKTYNFDYTALGQRTTDFMALYNTYKFFLHVCGPIARTLPGACANPPLMSTVQMTGDEVTCYQLSAWDPITQVSFYDPMHPEMGLTLNMSTGPSGRTAVVSMLCSQSSIESVTADEPQVKTYLYTVQSKECCQTGTPSPGAPEGSSSSLSGGWIFIIFLVALVAVYFLFGALVMHYRYGKGGKEMVPNIGFWQQLPGLVKDGCKVTWAKLQLWICKRGAALEPGTSATRSEYGTL